MSKARLVITAVVVEGRSQSAVAREYGVSQGWISRLGFAVPTAGRDGVRAASACQLGAVGDPGAGIFGRSGVRLSSLIMYQVVTVMYAPQMTTGK